MRYRVSESGFTLIEIIVGIVMLSISLSIITSLILPSEEHSADQIHQVKAAELAQSLMNDIMGKAFDQNSDMAGGRVRCNENLPSPPLCTNEANFGPDGGESDGSGVLYRSLANDVDDFHGYTELVNSTDGGLEDGYNNFILSVAVQYACGELGYPSCGSNPQLAKKIYITVTTPLGSEFEFTSYRTNF